MLPPVFSQFLAVTFACNSLWNLQIIPQSTWNPKNKKFVKEARGRHFYWSFHITQAVLWYWFSDCVKTDTTTVSRGGNGTGEFLRAFHSRVIASPPWRPATLAVSGYGRFQSVAKSARHSAICSFPLVFPEDLSTPGLTGFHNTQGTDGCNQIRPSSWTFRVRISHRNLDRLGCVAILQNIANYCIDRMGHLQQYA